MLLTDLLWKLQFSVPCPSFDIGMQSIKPKTKAPTPCQANEQHWIVKMLKLDGCWGAGRVGSGGWSEISFLSISQIAITAVKGK